MVFFQHYLVILLQGKKGISGPLGLKPTHWCQLPLLPASAYACTSLLVIVNIIVVIS